MNSTISSMRGNGDLSTSCGPRRLSEAQSGLITIDRRRRLDHRRHHRRALLSAPELRRARQHHDSRFGKVSRRAASSTRPPATSRHPEFHRQRGCDPEPQHHLRRARQSNLPGRRADSSVGVLPVDTLNRVVRISRRRPPESRRHAADRRRHDRLRRQGQYHQPLRRRRLYLWRCQRRLLGPRRRLVGGRRARRVVDRRRDRRLLLRPQRQPAAGDGRSVTWTAYDMVASVPRGAQHGLVRIWPGPLPLQARRHHANRHHHHGLRGRQVDQGDRAPRRRQRDEDLHRRLRGRHRPPHQRAGVGQQYAPRSPRLRRHDHQRHRPGGAADELRQLGQAARGQLADDDRRRHCRVRYIGATTRGFTGHEMIDPVGLVPGTAASTTPKSAASSPPIRSCRRPATCRVGIGIRMS